MHFRQFRPGLHNILTIEPDFLWKLDKVKNQFLFLLENSRESKENSFKAYETSWFKDVLHIISVDSGEQFTLLWVELSIQRERKVVIRCFKIRILQNR